MMPIVQNNETWLPVIGCEGRYEVSDQGRVRSLICNMGHRRTPYVLSPNINWAGYHRVNLYPKRKGAHRTQSIHRLVLEAFVGPCPDGHETRHIDGIRSNNQLRNLSWGSKKENFKDQVRHETAIRGKRCWAAKLDEQSVRDIRRRTSAGEPQRKLGREFGVSQSAVSAIVRRKSYAYLPAPPASPKVSP